MASDPIFDIKRPLRERTRIALSAEGLNIENMTSKSKGENACTLIDVSSAPTPAAVEHIRSITGMLRVRVV